MNPYRFIITLILAGLLLLGLWLPANAAPVPQQFFTPTPGIDGRIIYVVQAGDSCTRIAALNGISQEQLRQLNSKLDENCTIVPGDQLLIGIASIIGTPTPGPSPTPPPPTASPTPFTGTTEICVLLFDDINGNSIREETEPAIAGGAISVTEINGEYSGSQDTTIPSDPEAYQGTCFSNVPEGSYNITVGFPDNYNPTMEVTYSLDVNAGDRVFLDFGAQSKDVVADPGATGEEPSNSSPLLGILGACFLVGGAALGYYAWRSGRPESMLGGHKKFFKK